MQSRATESKNKLGAGLYVLCRKIAKGPAAHQFLALVPELPHSLNGMTKVVAGIRCVILGAYETSGYLRAAAFADSDRSFFENRVNYASASDVQIDRLNLQVCSVSEDSFLEAVYRAFANYRSWEGSGRELRYPSGSWLLSKIWNQLQSSNFNSNSWAQSVIYWACADFAPGIVIRDFDGLDVGNDRLIPQSYFRPRDSRS